MQSSGQLEYEFSKRISTRAIFFLALLIIAYCVLGWRLYEIQFVQHDEFAESAQNYIKSNITWMPRRGRILDSKGRDLAVSVKTPSCAFDPKIADLRGVDRMSVIEKLAGALELTPAQMDKVYTGAMRQKSRFVWIKRRLSNAEIEKVKDLKLPGILFPVEYTRKYPQAETASQVLGFSDIDGKGREGLEKICDSILRGIGGKREVARDAVGRKLADKSEELKSMQPGLDVSLTIDSYIQGITERELEKAVVDNKALSGSALVMDPATGDILAMAGYPWFDPNVPADFPAANRLNPNVASVFEPGSIFKSIVMAVALQSKEVTPKSEFNCEGGAWRMPESGRVLHDTHGYGVIPASTILVKSSNIGMAKIAAVIGRKKLYDGLSEFGIGKKTTVPLSGELRGTLRPHSKWTSYSMGSIPMGQEVTVTPLQAVTAYAALANGGIMLKPRIVKNIYSDDKVEKSVPVTPLKRVIDPEVSLSILDMLKETVEAGTGKRARSKQYTVGGKTGTAQLACNAEEIAAGHKGYSPDRYVGSFIAVSPIERPRLVVLVSIREPHTSHYGGVVAAPAVKNIIEHTLNYLKVPTSPEKKDKSVMVKLGDLLENVGVKKIDCDPEMDIAALEYDSRKVVSGTLFAALAGVNTDGDKYIKEAEATGAVAVLSASEQEFSGAQVIAENPRLALQQIAANFYRNPEEQLKLVGITGTNGKTTIAQIISYVLKKLGHKAGTLGTVGYDLVSEELTAPLTTPESPEFQHYLARIISNGGEYAVCEYSSQALAQQRVSGQNVDVAVFTNLSRDHLDNHGSMENYLQAKKMLFDALSKDAVAVINTADSAAESIIRDSDASVIKVGYDTGDDYEIQAVDYSAAGTVIRFVSKGGKYIINSGLVGDFNVLNLMQALAVLVSLECSVAEVIPALEGFTGVGGRLERINAADGRVAFVDYAHTDDALEKALLVLRKIVTGRLIVVFGCGGDRDRGKRPLMGRVAEKHADLVVVTNDNPRTEDPERIISDILQGFEDEEKIIVDFERKRAIETALGIAGAKDIVLVAGKGHEDYQIIGREKIHFDDREVIRAMFSRIGER